MWSLEHWHKTDKLLFGPELGFQTGNQIRLSQSLLTGGDNAVPVYLNTKTPIDILFVSKWVFHKPFFVEAKGGVAYISAEATGGDIKTNNSWLPDLQAGIGVGLSTHSRLVLAYQRFFGKAVKISTVDINEGISALSGMPTWQAFLFTIEVKV